MVVKRFCDRCEEEIKSSDKVHSITLTKAGNYYNEMRYYSEELCELCSTDVASVLMLNPKTKKEFDKSVRRRLDA